MPIPNPFVNTNAKLNIVPKIVKEKMKSVNIAETSAKIMVLSVSKFQKLIFLKIILSKILAGSLKMHPTITPA